MKKEMLAYLAGVVDSDGTIGIKRNSYAMRVIGDCTQATYSERVCVKQVEPQAVDLLRRIFAGYRGMENPQPEAHRALHVWQVTDKKAVACLRVLLPFLRIKKRQAVNCLRLRDLKEMSKKSRVAVGRCHVGSAPRSAEMSRRMEALLARAHSLNHVGK